MRKGSKLHSSYLEEYEIISKHASGGNSEVYKVKDSEGNTYALKIINKDSSKEQLASKIWESANKMRSKIEANEYKDYILGFIFYKFLSDKEENTLRKMGLSGDFKIVSEDNTRIVKTMQNEIGYFISYDNLFSTWIAKKEILMYQM